MRGQQSGETTFRSAKDFEASYKEIMKAEQSINKYNADYKAKLEKEMQKFNGKILVPEGAETNSEMTNATRQTKKSRQSGVRFGSPGVDDLIGFLGSFKRIKDDFGSNFSSVNKSL